MQTFVNETCSLFLGRLTYSMCIQVFFYHFPDSQRSNFSQRRCRRCRWLLADHWSSWSRGILGWCFVRHRVFKNQKLLYLKVMFSGTKCVVWKFSTIITCHMQTLAAHPSGLQHTIVHCFCLHASTWQLCLDCWASSSLLLYL